MTYRCLYRYFKCSKDQLLEFFIEKGFFKHLLQTEKSYKKENIKQLMSLYIAQTLQIKLLLKIK